MSSGADKVGNNGVVSSHKMVGCGSDPFTPADSASSVSSSTTEVKKKTKKSQNSPRTFQVKIREARVL